MILSAVNIKKSFGKKNVLNGISFELVSGKLYGIVGENGSGKSTLLKVLVGQWKADSGAVKISGRIGYCPQKPLLFPQLTVAEHFKYFSAAYGLDKIEEKKNSEYLLNHFNFTKTLKDKVSNLSGGTQQKLNLSIALLHEPDLLILDEPYNGFDWETYLRFWDYTDIMLKRGCAVLIVTHLLNEKDRFDRIYKLKNGMLQ
jgi:ABC-2 type transport system ATP-binding protein